jgi:hypothetical protein
MAKVLRVACKANKLGDSGSSAVLLKRLLAAGKKTTSAAEKKKPTSKSKKNVASKKKAPHSLFKSVKNGGMRLSASEYFKQVAGGKLYNCEPQWIRQPDGRKVLKKIKLCNDAWGGRCAKWVNA